MVLLGVFVTGTLVIKEASINVRNSFLDKAGSLINVKYMLLDDLNDYVSWSKEEKNQEETFKFYYDNLNQLVGQSDFVLDYSYSLYMFNYTDCLSLDYNYTEDMFNKGIINRILLFGVDKTAFVDMETYDINITEGRSFTTEEITDGTEVCIISENLYRYDESGKREIIELGDQIPVNVIVFEGTNGSLQPLKEKEIDRNTKYLTVVGKFHSNTENDSLMSCDNRIYVPNNVVMACFDAYKTMDFRHNIYKGKRYVTNGAYCMGITNVIIQTDTLDHCWSLSEAIDDKLMILNKGPNNLKKTQLIGSKGDDLAPITMYYRSIRSSDAYMNVSWVLKTLDNISGIILYVSIGAFMVILSLIIYLFLKNRQIEIGVLMSLGEGKRCIVIQLVLEMFVIAFLSFGLSTMIGYKMAKPISDNMINTTIQSGQETGTTDSEGNLINRIVDIDEEDIIEMYKIELTFEEVFKILVIEISVVLSASLATVYYITRFKPKEVLLG